MNIRGENIFRSKNLIGGGRSKKFSLKILIILSFAIVCFGFVSAVPQINFVDPTPDDGGTVTNSFVEINASINESNLKDFVWNWDGTNYTLFNDSLVLMMNFDNASSLGENDTYVFDVSGNGNNGSCSGDGCPNYTSNGKYLGAFEFDGTDDYFNCSKINISSFPELTMSLWIYLKSSGYPIILAKGRGYISATTRDFEFGLYDDNDIYFSMSNGTDVFFNEYNGLGTVMLNQWSFLTVTWDGTTNADSLKFYINGTESGSGTPTQTIDKLTNNYYLTIGRGSTSYPFNGTIDEVKIWNRSLSADEINQTYFSNLNRYSQSNWTFYTNQTDLDSGTYTYEVFASNSSGDFNTSSQKSLIIKIVDFILFSYPSQYTIFQRHNLTHGGIKIFGRYNYSETIAPNAIEAKFGNGNWENISTSLSGGIYNGTFNASVGNNTLYVRFSNNHSMNYSVSNIGVGDLYVLGGQSNMEGQASNPQSLNSSNQYISTVYREDDSWVLANDPVDVDTSSGSPIPLLANYIIQNQSVPAGFISTALGSSAISTWQKGQANYNNMYNQISEATNGTMKVKTLLFHQGEQDTYTEDYYDTYKSFLSNTSRDFLNDTQIAEEVLVAQIGDCYSYPVAMNRTTLDNIRRAQLDSWNENTNVSVGPTLYDIGLLSGRVHFYTDAQIQSLAQRWWASIGSVIYSIGDGRGPIINNITMTEGSNDSLILNFTEDSLPLKIEYWNGTSSSLASGFSVYLANGTFFNNSCISSTEIINQYQLMINFTFDLTSEANISLGSFNDGSGVPIVRDSSSYSLPAETFYNQTITYLYLPTAEEEEETTEEEQAGGGTIYLVSSSQLKKGYSRFMKKNQKVSFKINEENLEVKINFVNFSKRGVGVSINESVYEILENETEKLDTNSDGYYDLRVLVSKVQLNGYASLNFKEIYEEVPAEQEGERSEEVIEGKGEKTSFFKKEVYYILGGIVLVGLIVWIILETKKEKKMEGKYRYWKNRAKRDEKER